MIEVGIYGASGYMGGEALRILLEHPDIKVAWATSRNGRDTAYYHRNLYGAGVPLIKPEEAGPCDVALAALPSGKVMEMAPELIKTGTKLIYLGADFRLKDREDWERIYEKPHVCWELARKAVYGIPELHREEIQNATVIANPGCFSSAAILGLAPLVKEGVIETERIVVDGLSGTAGVGAEPDLPIHHPEIGNNIVPYNVVDHRHTYEMEQELGNLTQDKVIVHFTSSYVPITRGILAISHCFPKRKVERKQLLDLYRSFYRDEFFIKVFDMEKETGVSWQYRPYPWVSSVSGTNFCQIGLDVDEKRGRVVVFSVLDSIGKGGAHAAVQNINLLFGLEETTGLMRYGLHPY